MKTQYLIPLFNIASLLIIAVWFLHGEKLGLKINNWFYKVLDKFVDFFCNVCERVNEEHETF